MAELEVVLFQASIADLLDYVADLSRIVERTSSFVFSVLAEAEFAPVVEIESEMRLEEV